MDQRNKAVKERLTNASQLGQQIERKPIQFARDMLKSGSH